jgi:hypothetical protein
MPTLQKPRREDPRKGRESVPVEPESFKSLTDQIAFELNRGGRFVIYRFCFSAILVTVMQKGRSSATSNSLIVPFNPSNNRSLVRFGS